MARGRLVLALGAVCYLAAWTFGSKPLYPLATGLVLAELLAWSWVRLASGPVRLTRSTGRAERLEGDDVRVDVAVRLRGRVPAPSAVLTDRLEKLGERTAELARAGGRLRGHYVLWRVPRGRYRFSESHVVVEDPFGLERAALSAGGDAALVVYPRLVELHTLFSETGARAQDGRRLLLRRPSGFDVHGVREYEEGESLRRVHWRSTARRGQLMVKELEDAPREEVAVLLDADAAAVAGRPPDSSFEAQVRAAGSLLRAQARRGRRAVLVVTGERPQVQRVSSLEGDWRLALELLAGAEPTAPRPLAAFLADREGPAARALELLVVTARLTPELCDRLVERALARRRVSLVYVDAASFARRSRVPEPGLLRLQSAGIPVAVLRRGDDLAATLSGSVLAEAAHA